MISNIAQPNIERVGSFKESKFGICSNEDLVYIFDILRSKLYSNKVVAVVREYSTNAADANVENGFRDRPVVITAPTKMSPEFKVRDFGKGLSEDEIRNVYCMYGKSTKRNSNDYTGQLGLGSKSGFAYGDAFTIVSYTDGVKSTYTAYIDESRLGSVAKLTESATTEENGVEIVIPVKINDISAFENAIRACVRHFKVKPNVLNLSQMVFQSDQKTVASGSEWGVYDGNYDSKATAVMGNIGYPINVESLFGQNIYKWDEKYAIYNSPIIVEFAIGDLSIAANREELEYNEETKKMIIDKMIKIQGEIVKTCEKEVSAAKNVFEARSIFGKLNKCLSSIISGKKIGWRGIQINSATFSVNPNFCSARLYHPNSKSEIVDSILCHNETEIFLDDGQHINYRKMQHYSNQNNKSAILIRFFPYTDGSGSVTQPDNWLLNNGIKKNSIPLASSLPEPPKIIRNNIIKRGQAANCHFVKGIKQIARYTTQSDNFTSGKVDKKAGGVYIEINQFVGVIEGRKVWACDLHSLAENFNKISDVKIDITKIPCFKSADVANLDNSIWKPIGRLINDSISSSPSLSSLSAEISAKDKFDSLSYARSFACSKVIEAIRKDDRHKNVPILVKLINDFDCLRTASKTPNKSNNDAIRTIERFIPITKEANNTIHPCVTSIEETITKIGEKYPLLSYIDWYNYDNKLHTAIVDYFVSA